MSSRKYISVEEQKQIKERAENRCEYCQCRAEYSAQSFVYEHIIPVSKDGITHLDNLCSYDPISHSEVPLYHPRTQDWYEHFSWSDDYLYIVGLTPVGLATVLALQMNREGVINIRTLLLLVGKHPPSIQE